MTPITQLLQTSEGKIVEEAVESLKRVDPESYQDLSLIEVEERVRILLEKTRASVEKMNLMPMVTYAGEIAQERFTSGYELHDIQTAYNVLEETIWRLIFSALEPAEFARSLGVVSTVLGAGKDALARTYVSLATKEKVRTLDLRTAFDGTEAFPESDY